MLIDPFTVGAQIVNFLLLIWLLRRVLYGPVTRAMDARDDRIRRDVEDARRLQAEAAAMREQLAAKAEAFAADRGARLAQARAEIEAWRGTQMEVARAELDASRTRWQRALAHEQQTAVGELGRRVAHEAVSLVRTALRDLADSDLEERIIGRFLERLRELTPEDRDRLRAAAAADGHVVHVRTAAGLSDADRTRLHDAVSDAIGAEVTVHVDTTAEPGSGVEVRTGGLKITWSLDDYLGGLENRLAAALGDTPAFSDEQP